MLEGFPVSAHRQCKLTRVKERLAPRRVTLARVRSTERVDTNSISQSKQSTVEPISFQGMGKLQSQVSPVSSTAAPRARSEEILTLYIESLQPQALIGSDELRSRLLGQRQIKIQMAIAFRRFLG